MSEVIEHNSKLWERRSEGGKNYFLFWCPGCRRGHVYWCGPGFVHPQLWEFNGNYEKPTFTPSLRTFVRITEEDAQGKLKDTGREKTLCHLHVVDGEILYCGDNPHALNGKTVPMEDIPPDYGF